MGISAIHVQTLPGTSYTVSTVILEPPPPSPTVSIQDQFDGLSTTLGPAYNEFGCYEHPLTTSSFLCIYSLVISGTQCISAMMNMLSLFVLGFNSHITSKKNHVFEGQYSVRQRPVCRFCCKGKHTSTEADDG